MHSTDLRASAGREKIRNLAYAVDMSAGCAVSRYRVYLPPIFYSWCRQASIPRARHEHRHSYQDVRWYVTSDLAGLSEMRNLCERE